VSYYAYAGMKSETEDNTQMCYNKIETDSDDIAEQSRDDKSRPHVCTVCNKSFTTKRNLNVHRERHTGKNLYSCSSSSSSSSSSSRIFI